MLFIRPTFFEACTGWAERRMIPDKVQARCTKSDEARMNTGILLATLLVCFGLPAGSLWAQVNGPSTGILARQDREGNQSQSGQKNAIANQEAEPNQASAGQAPAAGKRGLRIPIAMSHGGDGLMDCGKDMDCFLNAFDDGKPALVRHNQNGAESGIRITQRAYLEVSNFAADHGTFYTKVEDRSFEFTEDFNRMVRQAGKSEAEIEDIKKKIVAEYQPTDVEELACLFERKALKSLLLNWSMSRFSPGDFSSAEKCEGYPMPSIAAAAQPQSNPPSSGGEVYIRDPRESEKELRQAVKVNPGDPELHYLLGKALGMQNQVDEALREFRKVVELNQQHGMAWMDLGTVYQAKHDLATAAESYRKAIEVSPNDDRPYINLCSIYLEEEQNDKTAEFCEAAVKITPASAGLWNNLAWLYATAKDARYRNPAKALEYGRKAAALSGEKIPEMLDTLALAYFLNGKFAEAVEAEKKALQLRPGDASFQEALARYQRAK